MKPHERPWRVRVAQTGHVKQKVIRGMGDRNCVQSDDTWRDNVGVIDVSLPSPLLRGDAFFLEFRGADQPVAQEAATLRRNGLTTLKTSVISPVFRSTWTFAPT